MKCFPADAQIVCCRIGDRLSVDEELLFGGLMLIRLMRWNPMRPKSTSNENESR